MSLKTKIAKYLNETYAGDNDQAAQDIVSITEEENYEEFKSSVRRLHIELATNIISPKWYKVLARLEKILYDK